MIFKIEFLFLYPFATKDIISSSQQSPLVRATLSKKEVASQK